VSFLDKVDPCLLADPYVVAGWVKMELVAVKSVKITHSGLVITVCVSASQRDRELHATQMRTRAVTCFALKKREPLKGVITGVAVNVKVDQLKGKIPSV
jgi:hypothetical protein